jgi:hypothetical protein
MVVNSSRARLDSDAGGLGELPLQSSDLATHAARWSKLGLTEAHSQMLQHPGSNCDGQR